jgi:hypothetical protein
MLRSAYRTSSDNFMVVSGLLRTCRGSRGATMLPRSPASTARDKPANLIPHQANAGSDLAVLVVGWWPTAGT